MLSPELNGGVRVDLSSNVTNLERVVNLQLGPGWVGRRGSAEDRAYLSHTHIPRPPVMIISIVCPPLHLISNQKDNHPNFSPALRLPIATPT